MSSKGGDDARRKVIKQKIDKNIETMTKIARQRNNVEKIVNYLVYEFWILRGVDKSLELNQLEEQRIEIAKQKINELKDQYLRLSSADKEDELRFLEEEVYLNGLLLNRRIQEQPRVLEGLRNDMFPQRQSNNQKEKSEMSSKGDEFDDARRNVTKQKIENNIEMLTKIVRQRNHLQRIIFSLVYEFKIRRGLDVGPELNQLDKKPIENVQKINELKEYYHLRLSSDKEDKIRILEDEVNLDGLLINRSVQEQPRVLEGLRNDIRNLDSFIFPKRHILEMSSQCGESGKDRRKLFEQKADSNIEIMATLCRDRYNLQRLTQSLLYEYRLLRGEDTSALVQAYSSANKEIEDLQELNKRKESIYSRLSSEDEDEVRMVEEELKVDELLLNTRVQFEPAFLERLRNYNRDIEEKLFRQRQLNKQKEEKTIKLKLKECWKSFITCGYSLWMRNSKVKLIKQRRNLLEA